MSTSEYRERALQVSPLQRLRAAAQPIPIELWAVGAVVVIAAVIRILTINNQSFWTDEALTVYETQLPFGAMIHTVAHVETTPPLYFVVVWLWAKVFGSSEVALRSISTLAGIGLVGISYVATKELVSRWAGVIAAAFVAVNPFMVWFSQEARSYMLLAALTGAGFLWFNRARRDPSPRNLIWWTALSSLALMTHFFAGFAVAPEALWLLWVARTRLIVGAVSVVAAVQLAMAPFALVDTTHGTGWIAAIPRFDRIAGVPLEWAVGTLYRRATFGEGLIGGALLIVAVVLLLALAGDSKTRSGAKVAGCVAAFVFVVPLILGLLGQDYFLSRNLIPAFVPLAGLVAAACVVPRARIVGGALALALLAMFSVATARVQTHLFLQRPDWREVAKSLGPAEVPRAVLAAAGSTAHPLKIYLPNVSWVFSHTREVTISEVDIVGARKRFALVTDQATQPVSRVPEGAGGRATVAPQLVPTTGSPVPRSVAPAGAQLLTRFRVDNWIVARFRLLRPVTVNINDLIRLAPRFFRHTPRDILVFFQRPGR